MKKLSVLGIFLVLSAAMAAAQGAGAGKAIFASKCALCHGPDGKGNTSIGKSLKIADLHSDVVQKMSDADLKTVVTNGKNKMPPFKGKLTDAQMDQVISYIRELGK
jgi:cytochrome c6